MHTCTKLYLKTLLREKHWQAKSFIYAHVRASRRSLQPQNVEKFLFKPAHGESRDKYCWKQGFNEGRGVSSTVMQFTEREERRKRRRKYDTDLSWQVQWAKSQRFPAHYCIQQIINQNPNGLKCILMISQRRGTSLSWYDEKRFIPFCLISPTA